MALNFQQFGFPESQDACDSQREQDSLDALEFLASANASLEDVPENVLQRWIQAVGGVDVFCQMRDAAN